jgi:hypothetical protein
MTIHAYIIRNADGSEWTRVSYYAMARAVLERCTRDRWLINAGLLPQTIESELTIEGE